MLFFVSDLVTIEIMYGRLLVAHLLCCRCLVSCVVGFVFLGLV
jgi:hypothetical protein